MTKYTSNLWDFDGCSLITINDDIVSLKFDFKILLNQAHQLNNDMRFLCDSNKNVIEAVFSDVLFKLQFVENLFCLSVCTEVEESQKQVPHELSENYSKQA